MLTTRSSERCVSGDAQCMSSMMRTNGWIWPSWCKTRSTAAAACSRRSATGRDRNGLSGGSAWSMAEERRDDLLEGAIQHQDLARHLLADGARIVVGLDLEVAAKDLDARPEGGGRPVGHRSGLEDQRALGRPPCARTRAGVATCPPPPRRPAPPRARGPRGRCARMLLEGVQFRRASHEARQPPGRRGLQARARGGRAHDLVDLHRRLEPANRHRAQRLHVHPSPGEPHGVGGGQDRARLGHLLHAGGQVDGLAHRGVVRVQLAADGAHHRLAGVEPHANLERHAVGALDLVAVARDGLLHAQRRVAGAHGVILVGERRAEEGHDAVAHHLVHRALVAVDGVHHVFEEGIEQLLRLLGIAVGEQLHRALEVGEEDGDVLALAVSDRTAGAQELGQLGRRARRSAGAQRRARVSRAPHWGQKRASGGVSRWQRGHMTRPAYRRAGACQSARSVKKASRARELLLE